MNILDDYLGTYFLSLILSTLEILSSQAQKDRP